MIQAAIIFCLISDFYGIRVIIIPAHFITVGISAAQGDSITAVQHEPLGPKQVEFATGEVLGLSVLVLIIVRDKPVPLPFREGNGLSRGEKINLLEISLQVCFATVVTDRGREPGSEHGSSHLVPVIFFPDLKISRVYKNRLVPGRISGTPAAKGHVYGREGPLGLKGSGKKEQ